MTIDGVGGSYASSVRLTETPFEEALQKLSQAWAGELAGEGATRSPLMDLPPGVGDGGGEPVTGGDDPTTDPGGGGDPTTDPLVPNSDGGYGGSSGGSGIDAPPNPYEPPSPYQPIDPGPNPYEPPSPYHPS
jgi:hypothetical protein